jgi:hypothetical protein
MLDSSREVRENEDGYDNEDSEVFERKSKQVMMVRS